MKTLAAMLGMACMGWLALSPDAAMAQATRTWVSGEGDDANPCSRTAPCKTFAGAISKTATLGEINCIDAGGFGAVTITKSIAIVCDNVEAGVLSSSGVDGIIVNVTASDIVTLKGLDIEGAGTARHGIRYIQSGVLHVHKVQIRGFRGAGGNGILFAPTGPGGKLFVADSYITDNGSSITTGGITIAPTSTGTGNVSIKRVNLENNSSGVIVDGSGSTGSGVNVNVTDSVVAGSPNPNVAVSAITTASHAAVNIMLDRVNVNSNGGTGVKADGAVASGLGSATIRVGNSVIFANGTGVSTANSGQVKSYTTNQLNGNGADGAFTAPAIPQQ